ncbi:protein kinase [Streptomyces sp. NPDC004609]|uniref:serine/threonine-protein kinase n=1 Tax=Streptomyces sp. NPDC004609 TaxID=3364704 RepID=UPI0036AE38B3
MAGAERTAGAPAAGQATRTDPRTSASAAAPTDKPGSTAGSSPDKAGATPRTTDEAPKADAVPGASASGVSGRGAKADAGSGGAAVSVDKSGATGGASAESLDEAEDLPGTSAEAPKADAVPGASEGGASASGASGRGAKADARTGGAGAPAGKAGAAAAGAPTARPAKTGGRGDERAWRSGREADGRLLAGRYRLGGVLGRGGMGTVWRAEDETLSRTVAVKELRFPNSIDEEEKRRLITRTLREAKAIARIRNNSAVTVYDVVDEDDRPWIVMELVEGKSLAEVIREDGTLTPRRAAEVGLAILDVLRSAHREGILHRDVKPSNVLISEDGRVVLTDFGIAQVEGDPSITSTGMLVGAPSYISPERARGHRPGPAADLWSLGGLLYASVEGSPPYDKGSAIATLTAVMTEPLDPPKNAGPLEEVIYGLLAKDPAQRLDDVGARALLTKVVSAPEAPEPPADTTRAMALPVITPPPPEPEGPASDRVRGALRSVRNAAAAPAADTAHPTAAAPRKPPRPPVQRAAPVRAPLTDVVPRRTLVIVAVVVALAVLGTVLYLTLGRDPGDTKGQGGTTPDPGTSAGTTAPGGGNKPGGAGREEPRGTGKQSPAPVGSGQAPGSPKGDNQPKGGLPDGYTLVSNDRFRFTMAMPKGFTMTAVAGVNSGGIFNAGEGAFPRVQVDFNDSPLDDAAAAWAAAVAVTRASSDGFKQLSIKKVEYNGYPTVADWQFERKHGGERMRVLNRGFKVDDKRGYSIMISCKASEWDEEECKTLRKTAFGTFKPKE